jgi:hypothetical protein
MAALQIVANIQFEMLEVFKIPKLVCQQLHVCGQSQMSKGAEMEELFWPFSIAHLSSIFSRCFNWPIDFGNRKMAASIINLFNSKGAWFKFHHR